MQLYQVEARQGDKIVARRGFVSLLPTGDILSAHDVMGKGYEFIEWTYSPFDIVCGFRRRAARTIRRSRGDSMPGSSPGTG